MASCVFVGPVDLNKIYAYNNLHRPAYSKRQTGYMQRFEDRCPGIANSGKDPDVQFPIFNPKLANVMLGVTIGLGLALLGHWIALTWH